MTEAEPRGRHWLKTRREKQAAVVIVVAALFFLAYFIGVACHNAAQADREAAAEYCAETATQYISPWYPTTPSSGIDVAVREAADAGSLQFGTGLAQGKTYTYAFSMGRSAALSECKDQYAE